MIMEILKINEKINRITLVISQIILGITIVSVFINVLLRYLFNTGLFSSGEYVPFLFTWLTFLGSSIVLRDNEHLRIDILLRGSKGKFKKNLEIFISLIESIYFLFLFYYGLQMTLKNLRQFTPYLGISYSMVYLSVPVASFLMFLYLLEKLYINSKR